MLKKRRGEIATLLTLGLVILGGVLAIGSSVFLSQQKTTSTKAAGGCGSGNTYNCNPNEGYGDGGHSCLSKPNLEFACCVADQLQGDGTYRIRWYGCTGQYCKNTGIRNALGHLVGCAGYQGSYEGKYFPLNSGKTAVVFSQPVQPTSTPSTPTQTPTPNPTVTPGGPTLTPAPTQTPTPTGSLTTTPTPTGSLTTTPTVTPPISTITPIPTATTAPTPTYAVEGRCTGPGKVISFDYGKCEFLEEKIEQNCSGQSSIDFGDNCHLFRICSEDSNPKSECKYECYHNEKKYNCVGAKDSHKLSVHITNKSEVDQIINKITFIQESAGADEIIKIIKKDITLGPNDSLHYDENKIDLTGFCQIFTHNIKVDVYRGDTIIASGRDDCGGGAKILIIIED